MRVTYMMKLAVAICDELKAKEFEIGYTDVIEKKIEALTFRKDKYDYKVAIYTERKGGTEYLRIVGSMEKQLWCITGAQLEPLLENLRYGDKIVIQGEGNDKFAKFIHEYDIEYATVNLDKSASVAIAKDIVGDIISPASRI